MPNRGELVFPAAQQNTAANENAAWALICLCAVGWLISVCVAVAAQPAADIPMLIALSAWG